MIKPLALALCLVTSAAWGQTITVPAPLQAPAAINLANIPTLQPLNSSTDNGAAFNTYIAAQPVNTAFELPPGAVLATTVNLSFGVAGQRLICDSGSKIVIMSGWAGADQSYGVTFAANNSGMTNCEIDGSAYVGGNRVAGFNTSGSPTGVELLGQTYIHDFTFYGGKIVDAAQIHIQDIKIVNTTYNGLFSQNNADIGFASIRIDRVFVDRSAGTPSTNAWPSLQFWGTATHPTYLVQNNTQVLNVIAPTSAASEGEETRNVTGQITNFYSKDGSIGLSTAIGQNDLSVQGCTVKGASLIGIELAGPTTPALPGGKITVSGCHVDGTNGAQGITGTATTPRAYALDGTTTSATAVISNSTAWGFTDDGLFASNVWSRLTFSGLDLDASSVTGAKYGDKYGIYFFAATTVAGPSNAVFSSINLHGGSAIAGMICAQMFNTSNITGTINCDGWTSFLFKLKSDGAAMTVNNIDLNIEDLGSNLAATQLSLVTANSGTIGGSISVGSPTFIPYAAGCKGKLSDASLGVWVAYCSSQPNSVINGGAGSTAIVNDGTQWVKSTALGTLTGWAQPVSASIANTFTVAQTFQKANTDPAGNIGVGTFLPMGVVYTISASQATGSGTAEQTLATYSLPANSMDVAGRLLRVTACWKHALNTNVVTNKLYFGGSAISTGSSTTSGQVSCLHQTVTNTGSNTQNLVSEGYAGITWQTPTWNALTLTTSGATVIKATSTDGVDSAGDSTLVEFMVEFMN